MLPMLQKHTLITAALLASLSLTACGKKKDVFSEPNKQAKPTDSSQTDNTNGEIGGGLPAPGSNGKDTTQPSPIPNKGQGQGKNPTTPPPPPPTPINPQTPVNPTTPPAVVDTRPAPAPGTHVIPGDYRSNDPSNVIRDNLTKRMTGGVTADGLVYTSSGTDELLNFLRARNEKVSYETRRLNLEAAASVQHAKLSVDSMSGDVIITLKVREGNDIKVYNVAGSQGEGTASPVRSVGAGNGERTTGTRALEGTVKCLDLDGGCENVFARLKIGSSPSSAIINVVFRSSSADLYFNLPEQFSDNPEYLILRDYVKNTIRKENTVDRIKSVGLYSFEVVNGRSGFTVVTKGANNELLAFAGPLLAPEAGTGVNIPLTRIAKDQEDSLDLVSLGNSKLTYANWIGEARLVANNGLGQIRIALKMRKRASYAQDQFAVTFMRKIKPLVEINDENLK
nr:hypothetical protein BdHM001_32550 [Bdellovibrio sp. HM001]BFD68772.1 hypothetical protein HAGR004_37940 [Bdellovibrio sp. HAGR004]